MSLDAKTLEAAIRDLRAECEPEYEAPEVDWDGVSPIDGEPVTAQYEAWGEHYVFTRTSCYRRREKP